MYYGDSVLYNDEQRARIKDASQKAVQDWRFRNVKRQGVPVLSAAARVVSDAALNVLAGLLARRGTQRAGDRQSLTLTEQR